MLLHVVTFNGQEARVKKHTAGVSRFPHSLEWYHFLFRACAILKLAFCSSYSSCSVLLCQDLDAKAAPAEVLTPKPPPYPPAKKVQVLKPVPIAPPRIPKPIPMKQNSSSRASSSSRPGLQCQNMFNKQIIWFLNNAFNYPAILAMLRIKILYIIWVSFCLLTTVR